MKGPRAAAWASGGRWPSIWYGHVVGRLGLGDGVEDPDLAEERVGRVEGPEGVEGAVAELEVGLGHQRPELDQRGRLVHRRHRLEGEGAELGLLPGDLGQDRGAVAVVEVGQRLGREEPDRSRRASPAPA